MLIRQKQADGIIKEEKVKGEREARYRTEERNNQKDREAFTQFISTMMIQAQHNLSPPIPQSINSGKKSVLNISTILDESTQATIISPVAKINVPNRNHNRLITVITAENKVAPKRQQ